MQDAQAYKPVSEDACFVSISGCHGAGKTTLRSALVDRGSYVALPVPPKQECSDPFERLMCRFDRHLAVARMHHGIWQEQPSNLPAFVVDRSIFDWLAYVDSMHAIGSISKGERDRALTRYGAEYPVELIPRYIVLVNAEPKWIRERLEGRALVERSRWRQDDDFFLRETVTAFRDLMPVFRTWGASVLDVRMTDLGGRISAVENWTAEITSLVPGRDLEGRRAV